MKSIKNLLLNLLLIDKKEQSELNEETKEPISLYHRNPTEENYLNLRVTFIKNYNKVPVKKENNLDELIIQKEEKLVGRKELQRWKK